jgi:hypothetical protein
MGNKIIIDEEVLAKLDAEINETISMRETIGLMKAKQLILENSTTISIDESIDKFPNNDEIIKYVDSLDTPDGQDQYTHSRAFINGAMWMRGKIKSFATEQSIISEIKSKEVIDNLKMCSGCGSLSTDKLGEGFLACCPDNNYKPIKEFW